MRDERIKRLLCATLEERTEWDEAPDLCLLFDAPLDLVSLDVPSYLWSNRSPGDITEALADVLTDDPHTLEFLCPDLFPLSAEFCGVVLRFEAWGAQPDACADPAVRERLIRAVAEGDLHLQPERQEARMLVACMVDGEQYWIRQIRGSDSAELLGDVPSGRLLDTLTSIAASVHSILA